MLHTPYGDFNLAKEGDRKRVQKLVIELQRTTDALTRKDIKDWRDAWQLAINVDSPNRQRLYDIYRDVEVDLHLSGCVEQRKRFVMAKSFKIVNEKGDEDGEALHYFDQSWFKQLMRYALEANFWGHSLIELGELATDGDGCLCYSDVTLLPRKHVIPEYGRIVTDLGQDWTAGQPRTVSQGGHADHTQEEHAGILGHLRGNFRNAHAHRADDLTRQEGDRPARPHAAGGRGKPVDGGRAGHGD